MTLAAPPRGPGWARGGAFIQTKAMPLRAAPATHPRSHRGDVGSCSQTGGLLLSPITLRPPTSPPPPWWWPRGPARGLPSPRCLSSPNCETGREPPRGREMAVDFRLPPPSQVARRAMRILFKCNTWPAGFLLPPPHSRNNRPRPSPRACPMVTSLERAQAASSSTGHPGAGSMGRTWAWG